MRIIARWRMSFDGVSSLLRHGPALALSNKKEMIFQRDKKVCTSRSGIASICGVADGGLCREKCA